MDSVELGLSIRCQEIVELVTDYLEDALGPQAREQFEAHLGICAPCVEYVAQFRTTLEAVGHVPLDDLPATAKADLLAAFRDLTVD